MAQEKVECSPADTELLFREAILSIVHVCQAIFTDVQGLQKTQMELLIHYADVINNSLTTAIMSNSDMSDFHQCFSQTLDKDPTIIQFKRDYEEVNEQLKNCLSFSEQLKTEYEKFNNGSLEQVEISKHLLPKLTFLKTKVSKDDFKKPLDFNTLNCQ
ncbi:hypothetical protein [Legionella erythra]|uniref:Uncharacterized protein n=1 Tax=Legionella erythra TaxID=448 RepID=A0A0W0TTW4_LEGER|nr:hypothetical protein [Legionella erythra]KTC99106.1 hypothetical protein Lery_0645 [Legionella erythra]